MIRQREIMPKYSPPGKVGLGEVTFPTSLRGTKQSHSAFSTPKAKTQAVLGRGRYRILLLVVVVTVLLPDLTHAQCSMCRAVTESNLKTDDAFTVGNGLNNAIIYLMFTPYVLAIIFFYAFYRKQIKAWFSKKFANSPLERG